MTSSLIPTLEDRYYTVKEVAGIFGVTDLTVRLWITQGIGSPNKRLSAVKIGKSWKITLQAMMEWAGATYGA